MSPELLRQAAQQALRRGLVTQAELADVQEALKLDAVWDPATWAWGSTQK